MFAVKATTLRQIFRIPAIGFVMGEILIVTRPNNQNIVMLSESRYAEMEKAERNAHYLAMIDRRFEALECGEGKEHDLYEKSSII